VKRLLAIVASGLSLAATDVAAQAKPRVLVIATGGTISNLGGNSRRTGAELV
jgi:L-asparaginase/Glu-tRNA(Gln) amidotransferase subunit D